MSTLKTTNIAHPSSASNNIVLDATGGVDMDAFTVSGSAPADSVNLDASGRLLVGTSSATANGGVLELSGGITFPATAVAASNANTLDDYEEGTWTPTLGGTATYSLQTGKYTKVGRLVYAAGILQVTTLGTGSASILSGLPFTATNPGGGNMGGGIYYFAGLAVNVITPTTYLVQNTSQLEFKSRTTAGTSISGAAVFGNGARVDFSVVYEVS